MMDPFDEKIEEKLRELVDGAPSVDRADMLSVELEDLDREKPRVSGNGADPTHRFTTVDAGFPIISFADATAGVASEPSWFIEGELTESGEAVDGAAAERGHGFAFAGRGGEVDEDEDELYRAIDLLGAGVTLFIVATHNVVLCPKTECGNKRNDGINVIGFAVYYLLERAMDTADNVMRLS